MSSQVPCSSTPCCFFGYSIFRHLLSGTLWQRETYWSTELLMSLWIKGNHHSVACLCKFLPLKSGSTQSIGRFYLRLRKYYYTVLYSLCPGKLPSHTSCVTLVKFKSFPPLSLHLQQCLAYRTAYRTGEESVTYTHWKALWFCCKLCWILISFPSANFI